MLSDEKVLEDPEALYKNQQWEASKSAGTPSTCFHSWINLGLLLRLCTCSGWSRIAVLAIDYFGNCLENHSGITIVCQFSWFTGSLLRQQKRRPLNGGNFFSSVHELMVSNPCHIGRPLFFVTLTGTVAFASRLPNDNIVTLALKPQANIPVRNFVGLFGS